MAISYLVSIISESISHNFIEQIHYVNKFQGFVYMFDQTSEERENGNGWNELLGFLEKVRIRKGEESLKRMHAEISEE